MQRNIEDRIVILGDIRIRAKSIKNYGIATKQRYYEKIYNCRTELRHFLFGQYDATILEWKGDKRAISQDNFNFYKSSVTSSEWKAINGRGYVRHRVYKDDEGKIVSSNEEANDKDFFIGKEAYLYITTYQKDNFIFFESEAGFDIREKCKEIDKIFQ